MPRSDAPAASAISFTVRFPSAIWLKTSNSTAATNVRDLHAPVRSSMIIAGESDAFPPLRAIHLPLRDYSSPVSFALRENRSQAKRMHRTMSTTTPAGESRPLPLFRGSLHCKMAQNQPQPGLWDNPYGNTPDLWY